MAGLGDPLRASYPESVVCVVEPGMRDANFPQGGPRPTRNVTLYYGRTEERSAAVVEMDSNPRTFVKLGLHPTGEMMVTACRDTQESSYCQTMATVGLAPWTKLVKVGPRVGVPGFICTGGVSPRSAEDLQKWADDPRSLQTVDPVVVVSTLLYFLRTGSEKQYGGEVPTVINHIWTAGQISNPFWNSISYGEADELKERMGLRANDVRRNQTYKEPAQRAMGQLAAVAGCMHNKECRLNETARDAVRPPVQSVYRRELPYGFSRPLLGMWPPVPQQTAAERARPISPGAAGRSVTVTAVDIGLRETATIVATDEGVRMVCERIEESGDPYIFLNIFAGCLDRPTFRGEFFSATVTDDRYVQGVQTMCDMAAERGIWQAPVAIPESTPCPERGDNQ